MPSAPLPPDESHRLDILESLGVIGVYQYVSLPTL